MKSIPQLLIAAPSSGSGKTTIARGLMALFSDKGLKVQPYKCGPDYIDTKFHTQVCGRPSVNLDTFMATHEHVKAVYAHYMDGADACLVEGMMGMYDGYDRDRGSSAEIARLLGVPVVLVVDARSAAYSIAPLLSGFVHFRDDVNICGVIFNKVGSARHYAMLQQVCDDLHIECFGYLPKSASLEQGSRYLGLDFSQEAEFRQLVALLDEHVKWQRILELATAPVPTVGQPLFGGQGTMKISVALNKESFSFIYQEHIDILRQMGEVTFFNPEDDGPLPDHTTLLYLPGGYPEKHIQVLENARRTKAAIRQYASHGGAILAECGGMMYLCQSITDDDGEHEMCGVLPYKITARTIDRRLSLGYRQLTYGREQLRGHEFHYTQFIPPIPPSEVQVYNARGEAVCTPVLRQGNVLASYTHLYWGETQLTNIIHPQS
jgi:cobyrinic acid a,c-diamide synthase